MRFVPVVIAVIVGPTLAFVGACSSDSSSSSSSSSSGSFNVPEGGPGNAAEVDCTHPGAGKTLSDGKCECPQTLDSLTGTWHGRYTCREGNACVDKDKEETFVFEQSGNQIHAYEGDKSAPTFVFDGPVCGEYFTWTGGPTATAAGQAYVECGTVRFTDATHYVKDSCYTYKSAGGNCTPDFGNGCPTSSGQCTNTGARDPNPAPAIAKSICQ
jgi:hypothetical protein